MTVFADDLVAVQQHQHGHADQIEALAVGLVGVVVELHDAQVGMFGHPAVDHGLDLVTGPAPGCAVIAELQFGAGRGTTEDADDDEEQGRASYP